jgi:hypothetical protein
MKKVQVQRGRAMEAYMSQVLHQHAPEHHEKAAEHHKRATYLHMGGEAEGAGRYAKATQGQTIHGAMHWIDRIFTNSHRHRHQYAN